MQETGVQETRIGVQEISIALAHARSKARRPLLASVAPMAAPLRPRDHHTDLICTKCGYAKAALGEGVERLGGGPGPGG